MNKNLVCVDASVVIQWLTDGEFTSQASELLNTWLHQNITLIAPTLLDYEVTATLRRLVHHEKLTLKEGSQALYQYQQIPIELKQDRQFLDKAFILARQFHQPTTYDTLYLALSDEHKCPFWTADKRFLNAVKSKNKRVHCLGTPPTAP